MFKLKLNSMNRSSVLMDVVAMMNNYADNHVEYEMDTDIAITDEARWFTACLGEISFLLTNVITLLTL